MKKIILEELHGSCHALCSLSIPSVLRTSSKPDALLSSDFMEACILELYEKVPFLLDVMCTVATGQFVIPSGSLLGPVSLVYGILMHARNEGLSAYQRLNSIVATKGHMNDQCLKFFNKMCVTLGPTSRRNIMDECAQETRTMSANALKDSPNCFLVGDNCDLRITTNHQATDNKNKDCHFFRELIVFHRAQFDQLSTIPPQIRAGDIHVQDVILCEVERLQLFESYKVLLGRVLVKHIPAFNWMKTILPDHIPHDFSGVMEQKSKIIPLQMLFHNEAKYEECVQILDETEDILHEYFEGGLGKF